MSIIKIHKLTINLISDLIFIITFCSLIFILSISRVEAETIIATATSTGTQRFDVVVVKNNGDIYGTGDTLDFGVVNLDIVHGWQGADPGSAADPTPLAIRINYLFPAGTRGISICSNNAEPYDSVVGMVNFDLGDWMLMCWRVTPQFPTESKRRVVTTIIDESRTEASVHELLHRAEVTEPNDVDLDGDDLWNEEEYWDFNHDGKMGYGGGPKIGLLSDDDFCSIPARYKEMRLLGQKYDGGYYADYLYMIDNDNIAFYREDPEYEGNYGDAGYMTVFDVVYGIQHAEGSFGDWAKNRELYVYPAANFDMADIVDITYTGTMDISFYSI